eukprot:TRINITY_DN75327_c0_g1_i1.p1 TRINITY_DN75327_c0_g1~~TRINITY_DN75327_c0_g1_i1.p1  ORF type:complete len:301 (+),score=27.09 TRINITY_DN75327_c0_g1_i1:35-937(+)
MSALKQKYEILEQVGQGSYATVHKAKNKATGEVVALKQIQLQQVDEGLPAAALREISILKELGHENIIRFVEVFPEDKKLVLVFEFADQDLKAVLKASNGLDLKTLKGLLYQMLRALAFCHEKQILHRDLKPQNVLVNDDHSVKVADFGLGIAVGVAAKRYTPEVVTLWYRAPEILLGDTHYTSAIDVWALGCIFAEMCTGKALFTGNDVADQLRHIFCVLGTPTAQQWPSLATYPKKDTLDGPEFQQPISPTDLTQFPEYAKIGPAGFELLWSMLQLEPSRRISCVDALKHPFFSGFGP